MSYSAWSRLAKCHLRQVFSRDPLKKYLDRTTPSAAVGRARHAIEDLVAEARRGGAESPDRSWVRDAFNELLAAEHERLAQEWHPAAVPPLRQWPGVGLARARVVRSLGVEGGARWAPLGSVRKRGGSLGAPPDAKAGRSMNLPRGTLSEVRLSDDGRALFGVLDRLENRGGELVVVDLKSGIGIDSGVLVESHRAQLLFYAGLVHANYGVWPVLELLPITGPPVRISYLANEAVEVREQAQESRARFNQAVAVGDSEAMGAPSLSNCHDCPFTVVCRPFAKHWADMVASVSIQERASVSIVQGVVSARRVNAVGLGVTVNQAQGFTAPAGVVEVVGLPQQLEVHVGNTLSIARVAPAGAANVLRARWNSSMWIQDGKIRRARAHVGRGSDSDGGVL